MAEEVGISYGSCQTRFVSWLLTWEQKESQLVCGSYLNVEADENFLKKHKSW